MNKNNINIPRITFRISEVGIDEISLLPHKVDILPPQKKGFIFETNVGMMVDGPSKKINIGVHIKLFTDPEKTNFLGELKMKIAYYIENFSEITVEENKIRVPEIAMINFISIALSTARGVLAAYTNNTPLKDAVLPVQSPVEFAKQLQIKMADNSIVVKTE